MPRREAVWAIALALSAVACHSSQKSVSVIAGSPRPADDPAVMGEWSAPLLLPPNSPPPSDDGAPDINDFVQWTRGDFDLGPNQRHDVNAILSESTVVVARALLYGGSDAPSLAISKDGVVLATGSPLALPPDRAETTASVLVASRGLVEISLANSSQSSLKARFLVGRLPASKLPGH